MATYYTNSDGKLDKSQNFSHFCNFGWKDCENGLACLLGPIFFFLALTILFLTLYRIGTACQGVDHFIAFNRLSSAIAGVLSLFLVTAVIAVARTYRPLVALLFSIPDFAARCAGGEWEKVSLAAFRGLNVGWANQASYLYAGFGVLIFTLAYAALYFCLNLEA